ncbi:hypothetical protein MHK_007927, partial [Candidatus Magnetomorum sp. HK-1]
IKDHNVLAMNRSNILARANQGDGGNIYVKVGHIIKSSESQVDASSRMGIDGNIMIRSPDEQISKQLAKLPVTFLEAEKFIETPCLERTGMSEDYFVIEQRDSIPYMPGDWLASPPVPLSIVFSHTPFLKSRIAVKKILSEAEKKYQSGDYVNAIETWHKSLENIDIKNSFFLISRLAYAYQMTGFHQKALDILNCEDVCTKDESFLRYQRADIYLSMGEMSTALKIIKSRKNVVQDMDDYFNAAILNNKGIIYAVFGMYDEASESFEKSLCYLKKKIKCHNNLYIKILLNTLQLKSIYLETFDQELISEILTMISGQPENDQKIMNILEFYVFIEQKYIQESDSSQYIQKAAELFSHVNQQQYHHRLKSFIHAYTAKYHIKNQFYSQAEKDINKAVFQASKGYNPELLSQWYTIQGDLYRYKGNTEKAFTAYQKAISLLYPIRQEFFSGKRDEKGFFEDYIRPVYLAMTEVSIAQPHKNKIKTAIQAMEQLKTSEIENYFKDDCVTYGKKEYPIADKTVSETAIIYPIVLNNELIIISISPGGMKLRKYHISRKDLTQMVKRFNKHLNTFYHNEYQTYARLLYEYLMAPVEDILISYKVKTLIIVPDDILRLIPFSALHDGSHYLVEKYAVITLPGLKWFDSQTLKKQSFKYSKKKMLICGLSKSFQGMSESSYIFDEVQQINRKLPGDILLNEKFSVANLKKALINTYYPLIHIATHGVFTGSPESSFLMTSKEKINMNQLKALIHINRYRKKTVDHLTLSACQTGIGDERSVSGLAGTALKAGVNSVLASLWFINDHATSILMKSFYTALIDNHISKAKALQMAQIKLIQSEKYQHPFYWAAFILVGN